MTHLFKARILVSDTLRYFVINRISRIPTSCNFADLFDKLDTTPASPFEYLSLGSLLVTLCGSTGEQSAGSKSLPNAERAAETDQVAEVGTTL